MSREELKEYKTLLESEIESSSNVFVIGHHHPDFDSIGSAIGVAHITKNMNKECFIIIDEEDSKLEPGVKRIKDYNSKHYTFININDYIEHVNKDSILFVVDTSKENMISIKNSVNTFKNVILIDHHDEDEYTINTNNKIIIKDSSSACEIVASLIHLSKIKCPKNIANVLLAGINLDTKRFKQNTTSKTHNITKWLIDKGADITTVNDLFLEEFESFCRISNLITNGTIIKKYGEDLSPTQISFTYNRNKTKEIYAKEDYAKAADQMMKFSGIDASFVLGFIDDDTIHISARSNKKVNVCKIMKTLGGGGTNQIAGATLKSNDILKIEKELMNKTVLGISEDITEKPQTIKIQQI